MKNPYYSKKVLKHFLNPKNFGKIKDASGIGDTQNLKCGDVMKLYIKVKKDKGKETIEDIKFETFGCLPPRSKVLINEGDWGNISSLKNHDVVLNSAGKLTEVIKKFKRKYTGEMLTLIPFVSPFNKFSVTPEHPVLCVKRSWLKSARKYNSLCNWLEIDEKELISKKPDFVSAKELTESDFLVFVPNKTIEDNAKFSSEIMKLMGYYLAEGYSSAGDSALNFAFNKNEKGYISEVNRLLFKIIGKKPSQRTRGSVTEIRICSRKWIRFFKDMAGHYAHKKALAKEILVLPPKKQWDMVKTYIKGDGCLTWRRKNGNPRHEITTSSLKLAVQIQEILARNGIFSSIRKRKKDESRNYIEGRKVNARDVYDILFQLKRGHKFVHSAKDYFLVPIKKITSNKYAGFVYNILVNGFPNSYLVKGFAVHNCGHAISISDIMCDLVKGKTLEKALKVDYDDVVKELGSIPLAKVHCSYLAKSALKAAIEDYRKNKK